MTNAVFLISPNALSVAQQVQCEVADSHIITSDHGSYLASHFADLDALVVVGALGICVRLIAPYLQDKHTDPAVVCIDSTGRYVIPVAGGHVGGANQLAVRLAHALGAEPVITTQSDRTGLWALDTLVQKNGWIALAKAPGAANESEAMNRIIAQFVGGAPTVLIVEARVPGVDELERTAPAHVRIVHGRHPISEFPDCRVCICITPYLHSDGDNQYTLTFIPRILCVGIGLARQASPVPDILSNMAADMTQAGFLPQAIRRFATINVKRDEPVVRALESEGYEVEFFPADELKPIDVPTPSAVVEGQVGTPSVCEAAAILSAGMGDLVLKKQKGSNYTLAVAAPAGSLRRHGHIEIVGAGPGDPDLVSVRGRRLLERADLILYAGSLVPRELTFCAKPGATVRSSASMTLEEQFALMKEFYDRGQLVVRLHTGDPCIYGAIEEQMNYFDQQGMSYHITPGISSFLAAAAELKSQFTIPERVQSIILTRGEGRTPMPEREQLHLLARSQSTMCIFLSASIADKVQAELLKEYPAETPVAVCHHLTWRDQRIWRGELKNLAKIVRDNHLTLTTLIVVGEAIDNRKGASRLYASDFKHLFRP